MKNLVYKNFFLIPEGISKDVYTNFCLVLEGGALRGLYTAGVTDAFLLENINASCVIGTSAGVLIGCNYVAGQIGRSARINLGFRFDSDYMGAKAAAKNRGIIGFKFIFDDYNKVEPLNEERLNSNNQRLICTATSLLTGEVEYFEKGKTEDFNSAMQASASMPYVSLPVKVSDKLYLDGGCACKVPYQKAIDEGYEKIIVVRTRDPKYRKKEKAPSKTTKTIYYKYPNFSKTLNEMNANYNKQCEELEELEKQGRLIQIYPSKPITISRLESNINKLGELYELGYKDGNDNIKRIKEYLNIL